MTHFTRRTVLGAIPASLAAATIARATPSPPKPLRKYRMVMNSGWSGANAWFAIAEDKGYLREEGIAIDFTPGRGAYTAAPRMAAEGFDIGYGDINSLIEVAAKATGPATVPTGVFMMFYRSPSAIVVAADGPIKTWPNLRGRRLVGHPTDVARCTFPAYLGVTTLKPESVTVEEVSPDAAGMGALIQDMLAGKSDGVFGYHSTQAAAAATLGIDPARLHYLRYAEVVTDLYGSALMASPSMVKSHPDDLRRIVRAFSRGVIDANRDRKDAVKAVMARDANLRAEIELMRLSDTLGNEMNTDVRALSGIGDVKQDRLARSIAMMVKTKGLPKTPATRAIFTSAFLPPAEDRLRDGFFFGQQGASGL